MYTALFIGFLFGGETILLPAIYFGIIGTINLKAVIALSILATVISDTFWYAVGRTIPGGSILHISILRKYRKKITGLSRPFKKNGLVLLFFSKFVYGTRTAVQILCGANNIAFINYFFINMCGILALNVFFIIIGKMLEESFALFVESPQRLLFTLGAFAICTAAFHILFKKLLWKKWSQS
jgi:membrane protein DedA with SNARE-associated domain